MKYASVFRSGCTQYRPPRNLRHAVQAQRRSQRGMTLLEVVVVVVFLGIIAAIVAPKLLSSTDNAKALNYSTTAQAIAENWRMLNENCGTSDLIASSTVTNNPGPAGALQLMVDGSGLDAADYQVCYNNTRLLSLHDAIQGSSANGYTLNGSKITLSDATINGNPMVGVTYANVTDQIVLINYQKLSSAAGAAQATTLPAAGDSTDPKIQFTAGAGGTRSMTFFE